MLKRHLAGRFVPLPRILSIEVTSRCNLRCVMCPKTAGFVNTAPDRVISPEVVERLEPILGAVDGADLSGLWGEAFLFPDLYLDILARLKRRYIGVHTVSNGTLITDAVAERLVALKLDRLEISIDAARPETYRRVRRGGELAQVLEGVRAVVRHRERSGRRLPALKLLFLGMTDTIAEFPEFVRLARSLGVGTVVLQAMGEYEAVKGKSVAAGAHRALGRRMLEAARLEARRLGVAIELFPPDQFSAEAPAGASAGEAERRLVRECVFPWDRAVIATTGEVFPCCSCLVPFGDLTRQPFEEIWRGDAYRALRRALLEGDLPAMCRSCTGQAWTRRRRGDLLKTALRLERGRLRQRLRRSPALRRIREALRPRHARPTAAGSGASPLASP
ncbi:MAG TPA: radical SAM protein [bacterium]|nr:radical SAM protein [bacterium]